MMYPKTYIGYKAITDENTMLNDTQPEMTMWGDIMKNAIVTIQYDEEKLTTLNLFLKKKNVDLNSEMTKHLDLLYNRYVPLQVKEFSTWKTMIQKQLKINKETKMKYKGFNVIVFVSTKVQKFDYDSKNIKRIMVLIVLYIQIMMKIVIPH